MSQIVDADQLDAYVDEILGDEPSEEEVIQEPEEEVAEQETEAVEEDETVEITHNGKPVKLKLDEVIEHAQKGFDYTTKTQELASQRRQVEQYAQHLQQQAQFNSQFQAEVAEIAAMDMQLKQYEQVNWSAYTDQDPVEASKHFQKYQLLNQQRQAKANQIAAQRQQMDEQTRSIQYQRLVEANAQLERELGKEWNQETKSALKATGEAFGYSAEELEGISDPRTIKVLLAAHKWQKLQEQKPATTKKVAEAPKLAKPGGKPAQTADSKAKQLSKILRTSKDRRTRENAAFSLLDKYV